MTALILIFLLCFENFQGSDAINSKGSKQQEGRGMGFGTAKMFKEGSGTKRVPKCMGQEMTPDLMRSAIETCEQDPSFSTGGESRFDSKNLCFTSCVWKNLGLLEDDMTFTEDVTRFVLGTFPASAQSKVIEAINGCSKNNRWPVSTDNNCASFGSMRSCLMRSVMKICKS